MPRYIKIILTISHICTSIRQFYYYWCLPVRQDPLDLWTTKAPPPVTFNARIHPPPASRISQRQDKQLQKYAHVFLHCCSHRLRIRTCQFDARRHEAHGAAFELYPPGRIFVRLYNLGARNMGTRSPSSPVLLGPKPGASEFTGVEQSQGGGKLQKLKHPKQCKRAAQYIQGTRGAHLIGNKVAWPNPLTLLARRASFVALIDTSHKRRQSPCCVSLREYCPAILSILIYFHNAASPFEEMCCLTSPG